jgi:hypothetical protein
MKHLNGKGADIIIFVDKSLYLFKMQNLLGGLIQVQLFMLPIPYRDSIRGGPCKEEKEGLELPTASRQKLKR